MKRKHWFWGSLSYSKGLFVELLLASFLLNLFMLATPLFTMNVYDRVVPNLAFETLWVFVSAIVVVYLFDTLIKIARTHTVEVLSQKSDRLISSRLFEHLLKIKLSENRLSVGEMMSRVKEFEYIRSFLTATSLLALVDMPFVLLFLWVIFFIGGGLVVVPLVAGVMILLYSWIVSFPLRKSVKGLSGYQIQKNELLIESLGALETLKAFSMQEKQLNKWDELIENLSQKSQRSRLLSASVLTFSNLVIQLSTVAVLVLGVYAIAQQQLTMGGLIAIVMLTSRTLAPLHQLSGVINNYTHAKSAYKSLNELMRLPSDEQESDEAFYRKAFQGSIEFKEVYFKYPNEEQYALEGVSFKIELGEKVGIIGSNASGKSTILKLILGLYEPERGSVLIDGVEIGQYDSVALRESMGYLPQEVALFKGTIAQNIRNAVANLSDEVLLLAGKLSGLERFVAKYPKGYNRVINAQGVGLSGGEKASIGLARIFAKSSSKVLLLDEPTDGMDSLNEVLVTKSIAHFSKSRTLLIVSHKQQLLGVAERLILLERGKVLLDDKKATVLELLRQKGQE